MCSGFYVFDEGVDNVQQVCNEFFKYTSLNRLSFIRGSIHTDSNVLSVLPLRSGSSSWCLLWAGLCTSPTDKVLTDGCTSYL